jgi:excinuclease ABC subunit A
VSRVEFSHNFEADGMHFEEPTEQLFSFNSPLGACPECEGFGSVIGIDEDLVVPNKSLSVFSGAVAPWRGEKMGVDRQLLITHAHKFNFPIHKPYFELSAEEKKLLWTGNEYFEGLDEFFKFLKQNQYKIQYRVMLSKYRGKTICPACGGARLKKEATYVKVGGKSITELVNMPISELKEFFDNLKLNEYEVAASKRLIFEINNRIQCLMDVGLSYLTLNRASNTLSGGESQRINLVSSLGSSLVGSLYVLDEPSIGLHPRDTEALIGVLKRLRDIGNTVVVVEHDKTMMMAADWIVDIGPNAGRLGGEVILEGNPKDLINSDLDSSASKTLEYLRSNGSEYSGVCRTSSNYIELKGCCEHNLKNISVKFPLNTITVVTGVSGSGKSTLVKDTLYAALLRHFEQPVEKVGSFESMTGSLHLLKGVELVDQNPIGKSSRSNPATYIKAYDYIRKLFADQQLSKQMGYTAAYFSFNTPGGRCEKCEGEGTITVPMQFMADVVLTCEECGGKRFKNEILEVKYKGASIFDVLEMTVNQAVEFFSQESTSTCRAIVERLSLLQQVGLGYIKLGQSSSSLSGGESQRVKLAAFLASEGVGHQLFIFDEPTTGLHYADIKVLMNSFQKLIERGHSVIIIEHNIDVIKQADYIIDLGPDGGDKGGYLVFSGTRDEILNCKESYTGQSLLNNA